MIRLLRLTPEGEEEAIGTLTERDFADLETGVHEWAESLSNVADQIRLVTGRVNDDLSLELSRFRALERKLDRIGANL
jgi:hypothetical protein